MDSKVTKLRIRPHHGLCINHYIGNGYSEEFVDNMNKITEMLKQNPKQKIILQSSMDALCNFCPNNQNGVCATQDKVDCFDKACLLECGFHNGQEIEWEKFKDKISRKLLETSKWKDICKECSWFMLCEEVALNRYRN